MSLECKFGGVRIAMENKRMIVPNLHNIVNSKESIQTCAWSGNVEFMLQKWKMGKKIVFGFNSILTSKICLRCLKVLTFNDV